MARDTSSGFTKVSVWACRTRAEPKVRDDWLSGRDCPRVRSPASAPRRGSQHRGQLSFWLADYPPTEGGPGRIRVIDSERDRERFSAASYSR